MSAFEILFASSYITFAIMWSGYLMFDIASDINKNGELNWYHIISIVIMLNLALFMIAKFGLE